MNACFEEERYNEKKNKHDEFKMRKQGRGTTSQRQTMQTERRRRKRGKKEEKNTRKQERIREEDREKEENKLD